MPIFSVRKVDTQVSIFDGATVIIGGLTREEVKTVNDKIPVLGNLPLLGKLFQSNAESYQKETYLFLLVRVLFQKGALLFVRSFKTLAPNQSLKIQSS
jgi:general secretion pathway protein D